MSMLSRAAMFAGRNFFGTRSASGVAYAGAAAIAAAAGATTALADKKEKSFIMLKPDAVQRGLVGDVIQRFEKRGYKLVAIRMLKPSEDLAKAHYHDLKDRPFFPRLTGHITDTADLLFVLHRSFLPIDRKQGRKMIGATSPLASEPGTIRGDLSIVVENNIIHGSDTVENAEAEIKLWFGKGGVESWDNCKEKWTY